MTTLSPLNNTLESNAISSLIWKNGLAKALQSFKCVGQLTFLYTQQLSAMLHLPLYTVVLILFSELR